MAERVCPVWVGWWLISPLRKFFQNPDKILGPFIRPGMLVLEAGSAMGFFSLPAARLVGPQGKVISIDLQPGMIRQLARRAARAGLASTLETRVCSETTLKIDDLKNSVDFAFAIAVVHEVPDPSHFFKELSRALKTGSLLLFAEPKGHVSEASFQRALDLARQNGLEVQEQGKAYGSLNAVLKKMH